MDGSGTALFTLIFTLPSYKIAFLFIHVACHTGQARLASDPVQFRVSILSVSLCYVRQSAPGYLLMFLSFEDRECFVSHSTPESIRHRFRLPALVYLCMESPGQRGEMDRTTQARIKAKRTKRTTWTEALRRRHLSKKIER